jgi:hypothetical protein
MKCCWANLILVHISSLKPPALYTDQIELLFVTLFGIMYSSVMPVENSAETLICYKLSFTDEVQFNYNIKL